MHGSSVKSRQLRPVIEVVAQNVFKNLLFEFST